MTRKQVVDRYFLEYRAKLIDIAAFLDRVDRATGEPVSAGGNHPDDFRVAALREGVGILVDGQPDRARRILEYLSDPTMEPIDHAHTKGAVGAFENVPLRGDR